MHTITSVNDPELVQSIMNIAHLGGATDTTGEWTGDGELHGVRIWGSSGHDVLHTRFEFPDDAGFNAHAVVNFEINGRTQANEIDLHRITLQDFHTWLAMMEVILETE